MLSTVTFETNHKLNFQVDWREQQSSSSSLEGCLCFSPQWLSYPFDFCIRCLFNSSTLSFRLVSKWNSRLHKSPRDIIGFFFPSRKFFFSVFCCSYLIFLLILVSEPLIADKFINNLKQYKIWQNLPAALTAFQFKQPDEDSLQICICSQVICWFNQMPAFWLQE